MTVPIPSSPLAPMSSLMREIVHLTAHALTGPVQAGSRHNAASASAAARRTAQDWAAVWRELDAAAARRPGDGNRNRTAAPPRPGSAGEAAEHADL